MKFYIHVNRYIACFGLLALTMSVPVLAQQAFYVDDSTSHCEIFGALSNRLPAECWGTPRSIRKTAPANASGGKEYAVAARIEFEYNSAKIDHDARRLLDKIARVLNDDVMVNKVVVVEGHADATGSEEYNLKLSERRAHAVREYLVRHYDMRQDRLPLRSKGESELYDPQRPMDGVNRRVEFSIKRL